MDQVKDRQDWVAHISCLIRPFRPVLRRGVADSRTRQRQFFMELPRITALAGDATHRVVGDGLAFRTSRGLSNLGTSMTLRFNPPSGWP